MNLNLFITILTIILIQSILLFVYELIKNSNKKDNEEMDNKIKTIEAILKSTKHDKILSLDRIKAIEFESEEVSVFSKNMYRDVKDGGNFAKNSQDIGTFYETVKTNLLGEEVVYNYFLRKDTQWKHFIDNFERSYREIKRIDSVVRFIAIPANKYFFYDEVYLYRNKKTKEYSAFEFLPSISNEEKQLLFYLELDEIQTARLLSIKKSLSLEYGESSLSELITWR